MKNIKHIALALTGALVIGLCGCATHHNNTTPPLPPPITGGGTNPGDICIGNPPGDLPCSSGARATMPSPSATNPRSGLEQVASLFNGTSPTNISVGSFATVSTSGKNWAWGVAGAYNLTENVGLGFAIDSIPSKWTLFTGQLVLQVPVYPFTWTGVSWLQDRPVTLMSFAGVGSAWTGGSMGAVGDTGGITAVAAAGASVPIVRVLGGMVNLTGWYETLTGAGDYSGQRIGICPNWRIDF